MRIHASTYLSFLTFASALCAQGQGVEHRVLLATAPPPRVAEAWFDAEFGLVVQPWAQRARGSVDLRDGCDPRFDADGNLWFDRSTDDGHRELTRSTWVLPHDSATPRPIREGEVAPRFVGQVTTLQSAVVKFCLDAGHGGSDPGAVGLGGLQEKFVNLDVCLRLQALMQLDSQTPSQGGEWNLLMTRVSDATVTLAQRTNAANAFGARTFLSVHQNSFGQSSANGTETFCYIGTENGTSGAFRNRVLAEGLAAWGLTNRGAKTENFYVLRNTTMPAALHEGGFITSPIDHPKLNSATERQKLALHLLYAIQEHHGFSRWDPGTGGSTGRLRGLLYDAAQGSGARITGETVALPDGRFVTTSSSGYWEFTVPAASQRYAATAAGYDAKDDVRTVPANGEVWGSLGLTPANVPAFSLSPTTVSGGGNVTVRVTGTPGTAAASVWSVAPRIPLLDLNFLGYGVVWVELTGALSIPVGTVGGGGTAQIAVRMPNLPGLRLHAQGISIVGNAVRFGNGAAVQIQ